MGYNRALEAAGAEVHEFEYYGSYQGIWMAHVTVDGREGFIIDYYGSCSGCDEYEATFGWAEREDAEKLAEFARPYLNSMMTAEEALAKCERSTYDSDYEKIAEYIRSTLEKS